MQFMGKDNVPFHTVIFPATLIGSGQPWTMMSNISVTEYLNYEGGKFSKSRGTGEAAALGGRGWEKVVCILRGGVCWGGVEECLAAA